MLLSEKLLKEERNEFVVNLLCHFHVFSNSCKLNTDYLQVNKSLSDPFQPIFHSTPQKTKHYVLLFSNHRSIIALELEKVKDALLKIN